MNLLSTLFKKPCFNPFNILRRPGCGCFKPKFKNRRCRPRRGCHNPRVRRGGCFHRPHGLCRPRPCVMPPCHSHVPRCGCHGGSQIHNFFNPPCFR